ncbi:hypothetical protein [Pseudomarimonas arenosa]|uniref:Cardiolipin synthase N-terminal domain-containing protein n=1 Tax=Pseudomarimonas arenosa TaxID=2774145 RepID=A0AAW3ZVT6_9GAMM|nr:hypothetical protein [Pseudomarimonas arenosa]MBD8528146.1 hypothetical protein [Pseudomarimonas arenosa]
MIRILIYCTLLALTLWSISEIVSHWRPRRQRAIGWGALSVTLIGTGLWMIATDLG